MIGYILTEEQANEVQGKFITPYAFIYCVQDINDIWFYVPTTTEEKEEILNSDYAWVLTLPQAEFIPPVPQPFPPTEA
jgi:hypothetical protein